MRSVKKCTIKGARVRAKTSNISAVQCDVTLSELVAKSQLVEVWRGGVDWSRVRGSGSWCWLGGFHNLSFNISK